MATPLKSPSTDMMNYDNMVMQEVGPMLGSDRHLFPTSLAQLNMSDQQADCVHEPGLVPRSASDPYNFKAIQHNFVDMAATSGDFNKATSAHDEIGAFQDLELPAEDSAPDHVLFGRRDLRPQGRAKRSCPSTWVDTDDTGNYDPAEEARKLRKKKSSLTNSGSRRTERSRQDQFDPDEQSGDREEDIPQPILTTLRFSTSRGKEQLQELLSTILAQEQERQGGLVRRTRSKVGQVGGTTVEDDQISVDITAKPFARGCRQCVAIYGPQTDNGCCSLVDDERSWPCRLCKDAGEANECELIVEPARKRACESCKRRKGACSFSSTKNHEGPCQECRITGVACTAGPAKEFIRPRLRYDRDWEADPLRAKKKGKAKIPPDCLECCQSGKPCNYPIDGYYGPCLSCKSTNLPCTIANAKPPKTKPLVDGALPAKTAQPMEPIPSRAPFIQATASQPPSSTPKQHLEPSKLSIIGTTHHPDHEHLRQKYLRKPLHAIKPRAIIRTITTNFSHPITFNCDEKSDAAQNDCYFCKAPPLAILGFGRLEVVVVDKLDGSALLEHKGGHRAKGIEPTKLCTSCTTTRLVKMMCEQHVLRPIPGAEKRRIDRETALGALYRGQKVLEEFCDLCAALAVLQCAGLPNGGGGCGLRLCEGCAGMYAKERDFGRMLNRMSQQRRLDLRADVELLVESGPLMRYFKRLSMQ